MESLKLSKERIEYFSDAVFAIAITLLIIEIDIPKHDEIKEFGTLGVLQHLIPSFLGFFISFMVIAFYWRSHLQFATLTKKFDNKLLWMNIWMLLFIVLLPFSTAFYAENFGITGTFIFYCLNLAIISIFNFFIINYIINKEGYNEHLTPVLAKWLRYRSSTGIFIWFLSIAVAFVAPLISRFVFFLIFIINFFVDQHFRKKTKANLKSNE